MLAKSFIRFSSVEQCGMTSIPRQRRAHGGDLNRRARVKIGGETSRGKFIHEGFRGMSFAKFISVYRFWNRGSSCGCAICAVKRAQQFFR